MTDREVIACYAAVMESGCIEGSCFEVCDKNQDKEQNEE